MAGPIFGLLLFGGLIAALLIWAAGATAERNRRVESRLAQIASHLGGRAGSNLAIGTYNGVAVRYRFATRGAGSSAESWTEADADLPPAYPLAIHLRRHTRSDHPQIERGEMIDVQLGDPAFDPEFLVEAGPADVARILLDRDTRCYLASHASVQLDTLDDDGRRVLRLAIPGWREDATEAQAAIGIVSRMASRVRDAFAAADASVPVRDAGTPYRPILDDTPARDAEADRLRETQRVQQLRDVRAAAEIARAKTMIVVLIVIFVALPLMIAAAAR